MTVTSLTPPYPSDFTRERLSAYFENTWQLYEALFDTFDEATLYEQPDALRHPLVFYAGHTAAFYVNKLVMAGLIEEGIDEKLDILFARGVDPHTSDELESPTPTWPDIQTVHDYRARAHALVTNVIASITRPPRVDAEHPLWALFMGLEHDRIHFETSSMLIRQLDASKVERPQSWTIAPTDSPPPARTWRQIPKRTVTHGRNPRNDKGLYGWDNEFGEITWEVDAFEATAHLVSNADFLPFFLEGGYTDPEHWTEEGWRWRTENAVEKPLFWLLDDSPEHPRYRAMFEEIAMPWSWPVEVNAHEAQAFCNWVGDGVRLMTEAEHVSLTHNAPLVRGDVLEHEGYNLNLRFCSPTPVDHFAPTEDGIHDAYGNVWQWLSDDFAPLPGFTPHPLYDDFSAPSFDELHATLRGGAWATTGTGASRHYRLWFRRHFYQHAGFRRAREANPRVKKRG
ncbi:MAG: 5-histidylcysteine sulfoxide synthase [Myxococcota bacterium]|nr:5-histidylcysteine sulfoxide synthase [Myxococcota bacterium]